MGSLLDFEKIYSPVERVYTEIYSPEMNSTHPIFFLQLICSTWLQIFPLASRASELEKSLARDLFHWPVVSGRVKSRRLSIGRYRGYQQTISHRWFTFFACRAQWSEVKFSTLAHSILEKPHRYFFLIFCFQCVWSTQVSNIFLLIIFHRWQFFFWLQEVLHSPTHRR